MGKKRWIDLPYVHPFLRVKPSSALAALWYKGVRVGAGDYLTNSEELMLPIMDVVKLLHGVGVKVDIEPEEAALTYNLVLAQFTCELALVQRDIKLLEWTIKSLMGLVDESCLSPWRPRRPWKCLSNVELAQKIQWAIDDLVRMAKELDSLDKGSAPLRSSADILRESKRLRRHWRKFLVEKNQK